MDLRNIVKTDPETLGGIQVFNGTRLPIESLFDHLEAGFSINEFLEDFPSVSNDQAKSILQIGKKILTSIDLQINISWPGTTDPE